MAEFGSQVWANQQLKFIIHELKLAYSQSDFAWKTSLALVLNLKERLISYGFLWHANTADHWIHRYYRARKLLLEAKRA
jgi:hypothetical protein